MTSQLIIGLIIVTVIAAYIAGVVFFPKIFSPSSRQRTKSIMNRLAEQSAVSEVAEGLSADRGRKMIENNPIVKAYLSLPFVSEELDLIEQAGLMEKFDKVILAGVAILVLLLALTYKLGVLSIAIAPILTFLLIYLFLTRRAKSRRKKFLDLFPDALDIVVRSVKAGYPINTSIAMVADSMPSEIGDEYKRIVNEAAYGYTLSEAVARFAERMNQPDINFFSVVISVQQETGGNLAEVLNNLSSVLRQRKHLRLKVNALSAEGKMTVVILVGIAFFMVTIVQLFSPQHFKPLLETPQGHTVMTVIGCVFASSFYFIRRIINFRM